MVAGSKVSSLDPRLFSFPLFVLVNGVRSGLARVQSAIHTALSARSLFSGGSSVSLGGLASVHLTSPRPH